MSWRPNTNMSIRYQHLSENKILANKLHRTKQQGSSIVLAWIVIIILTLLGSVLMRIISTSSETVSQEVLGTRAYMAANSAMQGELQLLFPLNTISPTYCNTLETNSYDFQKALNEDIPGLYDCEAKTSCENYSSNRGVRNSIKISRWLFYSFSKFFFIKIFGYGGNNSKNRGRK